MKRLNSRSRRRTWMPVIDRQIGSVESRLWQRDTEYDFDWQSTDPWTRRIVYYTDAKLTGR
jgi:hypothetical protein